VQKPPWRRCETDNVEAQQNYAPGTAARSARNMIAGLSRRTTRMTLEDARQILEAEVLVGSNLHQVVVDVCCGADLMSDVLAFTKTGALLLTGLTNAQVVRTAEMADAVAICFVRGKKPPEETVALARRNEIPLLTTQLPMFESCGRLYRGGLKGCSEASG
jgi:predicted transcriptional regulator